jgi:mxaJ protein
MCSPFLKFFSVAACALLISTLASAQSEQLRVCADPDNMPFSNSNKQGFENSIAQIVARALGE